MRVFTPEEFDAHYEDWRVVEQATAALEAEYIAVEGDEILLVRFPVQSWAWTLRRTSQQASLGPGVLCLPAPRVALVS
jgi:hypothetical protein